MFVWKGWLSWEVTDPDRPRDQTWCACSDSVSFSGQKNRAPGGGGVGEGSCRAASVTLTGVSLVALMFAPEGLTAPDSVRKNKSLVAPFAGCLLCAGQ